MIQFQIDIASGSFTEQLVFWMISPKALTSSKDRLLLVGGGVIRFICVFSFRGGTGG